MKKFIMTCPLQGVEMDGTPKLNSVIYESDNNEKLYYGKETRFPIMNVMHAFVQKGEEVQLIVLRADYNNTEKNMELLREEVQSLESEKGCNCQIKEIVIPYNETLETHYYELEKLVESLENKDVIYACLTYGTKPTAMILMMAMNYAYQMLHDVQIGCIVYGQMNHNSKKGVLFDATSMFYMDQMINKISRMDVKEPLKTIKMLLSL